MRFEPVTQEDALTAAGGPGHLPDTVLQGRFRERALATPAIARDPRFFIPKHGEAAAHRSRRRRQLRTERLRFGPTMRGREYDCPENRRRKALFFYGAPTILLQEASMGLPASLFLRILIDDDFHGTGSGRNEACSAMRRAFQRGRALR